MSSTKYIDEKGIVLPSVYVEDAQKSWLKLGKYIKDIFNIPTIGITGSVGKTTTVMFAENVFSEKYNVFVSGPGGKNYNVPVAITKAMIRRYNSKFNLHVQECGGGRSRLVEESAELINADVFGITGVNLHHHTDEYNGSDDLIWDKTSFDRCSKKDAIGIINIDDDILNNYNFKHKTITFAINNEDADYRAQNIVQDGKWLKFDIIENNEVVPIKIKIVGKHNVYNALMVYIMAKLYNLSNKEIQNGFMKYESNSIRQNVVEIAGRTMYIDCFNVCADSIKSCCEAMKEFKLPPKCRRIAIFNGENALGEKHYDVNYETGKDLSSYEYIDRFIFVGIKPNSPEKEFNYYGNARALFDGYTSIVNDKKVTYLDDLEELAKILREETKEGDVILFKGIFRLPLFAAIDMAFGTSYLMYNPNFKGKTVVDRNYAAGSYEELSNAVNIFRVKTNSLNPVIPKKIDNCDVYRIGRGIFKDKEIESIDFGRSTKAIGAFAFANCSKIKNIEMTRNIKMIENNAFEKCKLLENVHLEGIEHIQKEAFKDCVNLKLVSLPSSLKTIEEDVFINCDNITFIVESGTFAHNWVVENNYSHKTILPVI